MPRLTDRLLSKRLAEYRALARADAKATRFTMAWRVFEFFALGAGVAALWFSVVSINYSAEQTKLARVAFEEQQKWSAWEMLEGNKGERVRLHAASTLLSLNENVSNVDFSCNNPNTGPQAITSFLDWCTGQNPIHLQDFSAPEINTAHLQNVRFKGQEIFSSSFENLFINDNNFDDVVFAGTNFTNSHLINTSFKRASGAIWFFGQPAKDRQERASISETSFEQAYLELSVFQNQLIWSADFSNANISATNFAGSTGSGNRSSDDGELPKPVDYAPTINISGTVFCEDVDAEPVFDDGEFFIDACAHNIDQALANHFWYFEDNPPKGLEARTLAKLKIRAGCPRTSAKGLPSADMVLIFGAPEFIGYTCPGGHYL